MGQESIYVASRVKHAKEWQEYRSAGAQIISSWIDEAGEGQTEDMGELWLRILAEVARCDRLVFFARPDDFPLKGALVEVGVALAMGKPVTVCLPGVEVEDRSCRPVGSWMLHPLVRRVDSLAEALTGDSPS